ncbi:uncharacterized protein LOC121874910 [Homarus americanus]|uniref:Putative BRICHOS domain-containing protein 1 n=1 Tax=Homarus americanus TaxID=6706 RepID=A0A8J5MS91_HOMAM|nr:uncharacterized protein LOC121874910 [Homarus americanus]XP_042235184.1 uncharacterized protein LOC121874910 [Homarus americanus]KAG7161617.1 putative BRICHOS domain-containing protein 1 [Homarus americanus]
MMLWLLLSCVLGLSITAAHDYRMCYSIGQGDTLCLPVMINMEAQTIKYNVSANDVFEEVSTLEDYKHGIAVSRVEAEERCYVRRLVVSMEEAVSFLKSHENETQTINSTIDTESIPINDPNYLIGETLTNFCGDFPVYIMKKKPQKGEEGEEEDEENEMEEEDRKRQVSVTFTKCILCVIFLKCWTTVITVPTGSTIIFPWFFG